MNMSTRFRGQDAENNSKGILFSKVEMNILRINNIPHNSIIKTNSTLPLYRLGFRLSMSFLQIS